VGNIEIAKARQGLKGMAYQTTGKEAAEGEKKDLEGGGNFLSLPETAMVSQHPGKKGQHT